jgi:hypothetical protein
VAAAVEEEGVEEDRLQEIAATEPAMRTARTSVECIISNRIVFKYYSRYLQCIMTIHMAVVELGM